MFNAVRSKGLFSPIIIITQRKLMFGSHAIVTQSKEKNSTNRLLSKLEKSSPAERCPSRILTMNPIPGSTSVTTPNDIQQFLAIFPTVVNDLKKAIWDDDVSEFSQYYEKMLTNTFGYRTFGIGHSIAASYKLLMSENVYSPENVRLADILGWCTELFVLYASMEDDIIDESETRMGALCWYRNKNVGMRAIVDAKIVGGGVYTLIKKYFSGHQYYIPIMELFQEVTTLAMMGQTIDLLHNTETGRPLFDLFTISRYNTLVKYKGASSNLLPVRLAMYLADIGDTDIHKEASAILYKVGHFWQVDNDILDCFGNPTDFGKESTDINKGRCTWLAVKALEKASFPQKTIFEDNYGKATSDSEKNVQRLYEDLDIFNEYISYKKNCFQLIREDISRIQNEPLRKLLYKMCEFSGEHEMLCVA